MTSKLPRPTKRGYRLPGDKAEALLFHGYTGSPYDLRPVSNFLSTNNVAVHVPLLKGHGTKPSDLYEISFEDWLADAQATFRKLNKNRPIIIGGLSMGALIAIILASKHRSIRGLILFSPSLKLSPLADLAILSAKIGLLGKNTSIKKISGSDIADPIAKAKTPSYLEMPIAGLLQFEKLRILALKHIQEITCPIFLAFGKNDDAINAYESHDIVIKSTKTPIIAKFYSRSKHVITLDYDRDQLCNDLMHFLSDGCGIAL